MLAGIAVCICIGEGEGKQTIMCCWALLRSLLGGATVAGDGGGGGDTVPSSSSYEPVSSQWQREQATDPDVEAALEVLEQRPARKSSAGALSVGSGVGASAGSAGDGAAEDMWAEDGDDAWDEPAFGNGSAPVRSVELPKLAPPKRVVARASSSSSTSRGSGEAEAEAEAEAKKAEDIFLQMGMEPDKVVPSNKRTKPRAAEAEQDSNSLLASSPLDESLDGAAAGEWAQEDDDLDLDGIDLDEYLA